MYKRQGLNHLIYEIVDNAVDEHLAGYCNEIHVTLEKDGSATIADNGRGVPVDLHATGVSAARVVYMTLHAGGKFDDSAYKTSGELHGVGSSVVNALSTYMDVQISRDGYIHHDRYEPVSYTHLMVDIGYFTAITMCYFLVEGYHYTRSVKNYALRLLVFGIQMCIRDRC